jgi:hypothetical protein
MAVNAAWRAVKVPRLIENPAPLSEKEGRSALLAASLRRDPPRVMALMQIAPRYGRLPAAWGTGECRRPQKQARAVVQREGQIDRFHRLHKKPVAAYRGCKGGLAA